MIYSDGLPFGGPLILLLPVSRRNIDLDQLKDEATPEFSSVTNIRVLILCSKRIQTLHITSLRVNLNLACKQGGAKMSLALNEPHPKKKRLCYFTQIQKLPPSMHRPKWKEKK